MSSFIRLDEPKLLFRHGQALEDPRDGLTLFGPLDEGSPYGIRSAFIGTGSGIARLKKWVEKIQHPVNNTPQEIARPPYPGFQAAFRVPWRPDPVAQIEIPEEELRNALHLDDRYQRVFKTVDLFAQRLIAFKRQEEVAPDIWIVVIPDEVYKYCKPRSHVESSVKISAENRMPPMQAKKLRNAPSLFPEDNENAVPYQYEVDFHNQLKARLLQYSMPIQIIRESTIAHRDFLNVFGEPKRKLDKLQSAIAWTLSTAVFYKAGGRPWKMAAIRPGVCYIGLVFKQDDKSDDPRTSCCAAQMFLDSGDGIVFKGAVGPWFNSNRGNFHLTRKAARELISIAVSSFKERTGEYPKELFIHGKVGFNNEEWNGFISGVPSGTNLVGIRIRLESHFRAYRMGTRPVLRGLALVKSKTSALLWTNGFIPRLETYPGREVPRPISIDVWRGEVPLETVLKDILALTKLNYNTCIYCDGMPVTLKFADAVGEILTAGPLEGLSPLPFKYYI